MKTKYNEYVSASSSFCVDTFVTCFCVGPAKLLFGGRFYCVGCAGSETFYFEVETGSSELSAAYRLGLTFENNKEKGVGSLLKVTVCVCFLFS